MVTAFVKLVEQLSWEWLSFQTLNGSQSEELHYTYIEDNHRYCGHSFTVYPDFASNLWWKLKTRKYSWLWKIVHVKFNWALYHHKYKSRVLFPGNICGSGRTSAGLRTLRASVDWNATSASRQMARLMKPVRYNLNLCLVIAWVLSRRTYVIQK